MVYVFRLILLCIPLFGAVVATADAQRIDRALETTAAVNEAEPEMVLALNTAVPLLNVSEAALEAQLQVGSTAVTSAGASLPVCLALVLLVTLVRQRV